MGSFSHSVTNPVTGNTYKVSGDKNYASTLQAFEANATNYQMMQEQNQFNLDMYNRQRSDAQSDWERDTAYNERMLAEQREYDSPEAQRQRLVAAGFNPLTLGSSGSSGGSGGSISAPSENTPDAPESANWSGAAVPEIASFGLNVMSAVMDALQTITKGTKDSIEAFELPQYVFNDTQRVASENALRNQLIRKYMAESPWWADNAAASVAYKNADAAAKKMVAERETATKDLIRKELSWFDRITMSRVDLMGAEKDKFYSDISLNDKILSKYDEEIRLVIQEIAESKSREYLNYENGKYVASRREGQDLLNDLNVKYGEDKVQSALRALDDEHAQSLTSRFMSIFNVEPNYRTRVYKCMSIIGALPKVKQEEFFKILQTVRTTGQLPQMEKVFSEAIDKLLDTKFIDGVQY